MKYWAALLIALLVSGCSTMQPGPTGAPMAQEAAPGGVATIRWVISESPAEDCAALPKARTTLFASRGCSTWSDRAAIRECAIVAPMPRHEKDYQRMITLGHEFWHCLHGKWHDDYGNAYPSALRSSQSHIKESVARQ